MYRDMYSTSFYHFATIFHMHPVSENWRRSSRSQAKANMSLTLNYSAAKKVPN